MFTRKQDRQETTTTLHCHWAPLLKELLFFETSAMKEKHFRMLMSPFTIYCYLNALKHSLLPLWRPDIQWVESIFSSDTSLTIITHKDQGPTVGNACIETVPQHVQWIWVSCRPHTGGCFHSKLLLFRNRQGTSCGCEWQQLYTVSVAK